MNDLRKLRGIQHKPVSLIRNGNELRGNAGLFKEVSESLAVRNGNQRILHAMNNQKRRRIFADMVYGTCFTREWKALFDGPTQQALNVAGMGVRIFTAKRD